jgi:PRTRC genetic system protein E
MFFQELKSLLEGCAALAVTLSSGREGAITVTVRPTLKDAKDAEALAIPLVLTGSAEELDAQFVGLLQGYAEERQSLAEQLEATRNILEAAKKDASKKAEGAIRKGASGKVTSVVGEGDDDGTETPEVVGAAVEDNLFA